MLSRDFLGTRPSTKAVGTAAEDYYEIVAPSGRHGFREEVASNQSKSGTLKVKS
jgi:hypothetical protein